uniref:Uncharacterized protein n=1 Tax=Anguilla anguilla TaxID=7936 RepID=A0A0E9TEE0_ANGAN
MRMRNSGLDPGCWRYHCRFLGLTAE